MGSLFLFTILVDDLNNATQFIAMSFCLSDIYIYIYIYMNFNVFTVGENYTELLCVCCFMDCPLFLYYCGIPCLCIGL